jgi:hypothetical protein
MPAQPFTVHVDLDDLARQNLADAVTLPSTLDDTQGTGSAKRHHGNGDDRMEARFRSEREHSSRASSAGRGRSYAFRRS